MTKLAALAVASTLLLLGLVAAAPGAAACHEGVLSCATELRDRVFRLISDLTGPAGAIVDAVEEFLCGGPCT